MLIDTHIHFGGSIPLDCIWEIIKRNKWNNLSATYADLEKSMIYDGTGGFSRFLDMFKILDEINWTEDVLDQTIKAFCAAHENTDFIRNGAILAFLCNPVADRSDFIFFRSKCFNSGRWTVED